MDKVLRCESGQDFADQNGNLVLNSPRHAQPVKADKCVGDVVGSTEMTTFGRLDAHHRSSVLSQFSDSLLDFIQLETSQTQSEIFDEKSSTAAGH